MAKRVRVRIKVVGADKGYDHTFTGKDADAKAAEAIRQYKAAYKEVTSRDPNGPDLHINVDSTNST